MNLAPSDNQKDKDSGQKFSDAWLGPGLFAIILAGLITAFFPDLLLGGRSLVFRDFGSFTYPNALFQRESFWHGEMPLWNSWNCCGIPFLAQWNTSCLYPPTLIYLLLPLTWGLNVFLLLHLFLAGFGMYRLASLWTGNRLAAAVAGVAFAFNGMTLNCLVWTSNLAALAWMPWLIMAVERSWLLGGRQIIIAALIGAFQMLSGAPEIIVISWLIVFALGIGKMAGHKSPGLRIFLRVTLIVIIVTLLSAAQLLPFGELLRHSERNSADVNAIWAIPLWGWANLFVPLFRCFPMQLGVYFQQSQSWTTSYYFGTGVLTLGLVAAFFVRKPRVWLLAGFGVLGFILAMGEAGRLYTILLKHVPVLGFMRYPIKFEFFTVFSVPLLAAFAIAWIRDTGMKLLAKPFYATLGLTIFSVAMTCGILWQAQRHPTEYENWQVLLNNGLMRVVFLLPFVGMILMFERISNCRAQKFAGILLLVMVWLDLASHVPKQNPSVEASAYQPNLMTQVLNPGGQLGTPRAYSAQANREFFYNNELSDRYKDYIARRGVLFGDCNIMDDIGMPDGFYSLYVKEQRTLFAQFYLSPTNAFPGGLADFLGISFMSDPNKLLGWQPRPSHLELYTLGPKPAWIARSNTPAMLLQTNFNPRQVVYLSTGELVSLQATQQVNGVVQAKVFKAQHLDFVTDADKPALLVLSQTYYAPWRAYVDGQPSKILRANYAYQAVEVPAGHHDVKLVYKDRMFEAGAVISLTTFASCIIFWWVPWIRKSRG